MQEPELVGFDQRDAPDFSGLPEVLTVAEVAIRLRCSKAHVCNAINGKVRGVTPLPAISMGRRKLVRRAAFEAWLAENEAREML